MATLIMLGDDENDDRQPTMAEIEAVLSRREREREAFVRQLRERLENFDRESTRSDRGFTHMGPVPSAYGGYIKTYESSAAEHPHIWVTIKCPVDLNEPDGEMKEAVAHLPIEGAALLAKQLNHLLQNHYQGHEDPSPVDLAPTVMNPDGTVDDIECCASGSCEVCKR